MSYHRISKLLIANRGEIACRVIKTAQSMGIESVAVFSEADRKALHVKLADEAHCIGPAASQESYLNINRVLSVAKHSGAQAIHPGYGFLSESVEMANECEKRGIIFVGPPANAIRDMGIKNTSKEIMEKAGVPVITGYHKEDQSYDTLISEARKIGFPVMIKAVRGGGGKGMRIALKEEEFKEQLESAKREAMKSFNNDAMLLEKFIETPRHVEVQVFGDSHGNYVYLFERDCSVQRRHQKILEEAPAPGISEVTRKELGEAAVKAAKAVNYVGAGTVEFIMDKEQKFYFMEMNTRLQVEHPITELITNTDLVEWQLRVASGESLPLLQKDIKRTGHAFESRIYAEQCSRESFLPTAGLIRHLSTPEPGSTKTSSIRIDTGVNEGDAISVHYDPMIAKLVVWSHDRAAALRKMHAALKEYQIVGLPSNVEFLQSLCAHPEFSAGRVHTDFIPQHQEALFPVRSDQDLLSSAMKAAVAICLLDKSRPILNPVTDDNHSPFASPLLNGFRVNTTLQRHLDLTIDEKNFKLSVNYLPASNSFQVTSRDGQESRVMSGKVTRNERRNKIWIDLTIDNLLEEADQSNSRVTVVKDEGTLHLFDDGIQSSCSVREPKFISELAGASSGPAAGGSIGMAPMPGVVERVLVSSGQAVIAGQPLLTMIAMKMEYTIRAPGPVTVKTVTVQEGVTVKKGQVLVTFETDSSSESDVSS